MKKLIIGAVVAAALAVAAVPAAGATGTGHGKDSKRHHGEHRRHDDRKHGDHEKHGDHRRHGDHRLSGKDAWFLVAAAQVALAEITEGKLAVEQGTHPKVKEYGHHMIRDHWTQLRVQVPLHHRFDVKVPTAPNPHQQAQAAALAAKSGRDFDLSYLKAQVAAHRMAIALFTDEAKHGRNWHVRAFAWKQLPVLHHHLEMAERTLWQVWKDGHRDGAHHGAHPAHV